MRLRNGVRLWTVKQAPFLDGVPTWNFGLDGITFDPRMRKRAAPGPFAAAPIIQGEINANKTADVFRWSRGDQVVGDWYELMDPDQGSIEMWMLPEWNSADTPGSNGHVVFADGVTSNIYFYYENEDTRFRLYVGGEFLLKSMAILAGTLYHIVIRWDVKNPLDGTNHVCLSINDSHSFGITSPTPWTTWAYPSIAGTGSSCRVSSIVEGFTIYRRPIFDGTYGIDVGLGDEINLHWAAGAGKDPCKGSGSWDVCLCIPTNSAQGEIASGTGEAWSHPHSSNLLGVGGFMMDGTYTNDGWANEGTPSAIAALATAEMIFNGGYKVTSDGANEGIYKDYTCVEGEDFVIRVLAHSDGTSIPKAILYDQTNTAEIGSLTGTNGSTRTAPDVFIFTGRAPSGCTTLRVKLINTDATADDITYWHQCELLPNRVQAPSMNDGEGDPWIPTGWNNAGLDAGDTEAEVGIVHSGVGCIQFNAGAGPTSEAIRNPHDGGIAIGVFCCFGSWSYGTGSAGVEVLLEGNQWAYQSTLSGNYGFINTTAAWVHDAAVVRREGSGGGTVFVYGRAVGPCYVDDVYLILLDAVSIIATPASEGNSIEGLGIRVDGYDKCYKSIASKLKSTSGRVRFNYRPRHDAIDQKLFGVGSDTPYVCSIYNGTNNRIRLTWSTLQDLKLQITVGGVSSEDRWDVSSILAHTTYLLEVEYSSIDVTLKVDGVVRISVTPGAGIDFGAAIPHTVYLGTSRDSSRQADAVFSAP
jgi:hypothetical protein